MAVDTQVPGALANDLDASSQPDVEKKAQDDVPGKLSVQDAFGDEASAEVQYKTMAWWQCGFLMVAETISLGILSLPAAVATLGLVPAIVLLVVLGLITTYTGYVIGQFKWRYPHIQSFADAGEIIAGKFGRELFGSGLILLILFIMGSHILTFNVAMNTITNHGTCTIVFGVVGLVISFVFCLPRTMKGLTTLSIISFVSIFSAVLVTMIAVGIEKPAHGRIAITTETSLTDGFGAVLNMVFAYSAHAAFFGFMAELKNPKEFPKALFQLQFLDTSLYILTAVVIYCYAGPEVTSPALGSASPVVRKVAYGIALPTIIGSGIVNGHIDCKYIYVRVWRGSNRMGKKDWVARGSWWAICLVFWLLAWIIAEAIPVFSNLLCLIASLFASWFTFGLEGFFWLHLNKGKYWSSPRKIFLTILNVVLIGLGALTCVLGLYVSCKALHDSPPGTSFSCADNS